MQKKEEKCGMVKKNSYSKKCGIGGIIARSER
jgi:hypothetical protein